MNDSKGGTGLMTIAQVRAAMAAIEREMRRAEESGDFYLFDMLTEQADELESVLAKLEVTEGKLANSDGRKSTPSRGRNQKPI